jgi:hypothetical protein
MVCLSSWSFLSITSKMKKRIEEAGANKQDHEKKEGDANKIDVPLIVEDHS